ncbi:hypothetical protein [Seonamhaeicola marinus]|uniref:PQQ-binding-like beta-propeller repeat protein n=1 Tax=Seonamhaeicola marinus TaxID=1912246 RepID=A0A5D0HQR4_9FLAO|nr:hypothetical protein [Seonamhaeicola marinus]TYA71722.1 hypothetical protein FUA24_19390 [Seonamhaeicola marinus]
MKLIKRTGILLGCVLGLWNCKVSGQSFTTSGNGIRQSVIATVKGKSVMYISELDGAVSAYTTKGQELWRNPSDNPAVMYEIEAADITNDGNDELLAASANGTIYCWNHKGKLLWKYSPEHKVRFSEVAVVKNSGKIQVFAGGNDYKLYELNAQGELASTTKIKGVVRKIEAGNFIDKDKQSLFLMTYVHDKFRWEFFGFVDPDSKEKIKKLSTKDAPLKEMSKIMMTDFDVSDIDKNGKDDILIFGDVSWKPMFIVLDGDFGVVASHSGSKKDIQRYAHSQGASLLPVKDQIVMRTGSLLYLCDLNGNLIEKVGTKYKDDTYSELAFDKRNKTLFAAGDLGGGNAVYPYNLNNEKWFNTTHEKIGRYKEVQDNLKDLYADALRFKMPDYQKKSDKPWMMITKHTLPKDVKRLNGNAIVFIDNKGTWSENTNRDDLVAKMGKVALKKDRRKKYNLTREEIVAKAKSFEDKNEPFVIWAGHGNDPFYTRIETLEAILKVAPNTCYGFIYAEMDNVKDPRVVHFVEEYVPRLAKAIRVNNKAKLYFRYKNMFWALTNKLSPWKELFFSGEFNDILVPASEDTSSRTQDVNLAGRVGMLSGGYIDDFAMRLIDDNPTGWRPLSPGGQRTISPYLRQGTLMASYGARVAINFDGIFLEEPGMEVLYALMKSGVLPLVEKEDIQSIGSWHLIQNADEHLIHSVDTHHNMNQYKADDDNAVFSVAQMHWAGASVPEHDYSKIALGVDYRWTNYMPKIPNGMTPIAPVELSKALDSKHVGYTISDGKHGIIDNKKVEAKVFGKEMKSVVNQGAEKLQILVEGASWSAIRLDDNHTRLILIDPGYLDPQERNVVVKFQNRKPKQVTDILKKEELPISKESIQLKVPAGSMRFIDVAY